MEYGNYEAEKASLIDRYIDALKHKAQIEKQMIARGDTSNINKELKAAKADLQELTEYINDLRDSSVWDSIDEKIDKYEEEK